jgi:hypothetical protein
MEASGPATTPGKGVLDQPRRPQNYVRDGHGRGF